MQWINKYVLNAFKEKYKQEPSEVSVGYENEIFVYCLMYQGKDSLVYAFYGIDNGEFVKAYRIDNGQNDVKEFS